MLAISHYLAKFDKYRISMRIAGIFEDTSRMPWDKSRGHRRTTWSLSTNENKNYGPDSELCRHGAT